MFDENIVEKYKAFKQSFVEKTIRQIEAKAVYEYACKGQYLFAIEISTGLYNEIEKAEEFLYYLTDLPILNVI